MSLLNTNHLGAAKIFDIEPDEPAYILDPIPSDWKPWDPDRGAKWREKFRQENRWLWDAAASDALQKWIENDCKSS